MSTKVSVVVPVYNASKTLDRAIESVLAQTMSSDHLELICVNDGSTDDSLDRLQGYAADQPNMTVITIPASGWPGRPRNVGTDAASGEYVMYLDADDQLRPESMQRMYDLGSTDSADIILGKVTSDFRGVHPYLYRTNVARCDVDDSRIIHSLTPHKMFRRAFLIEQGLRYPEGPHRLEDQLFVISAYLRARSCAVVADYVCYRYLRQEGRTNIASRIVAPSEYYDRVRVILDEVDRLTEPGPRRDRVYRRILRVEALAKVTGRRILVREPRSLERWLAAIHAVLQERFDPALDTDLSATMRVRAHLVRNATSRELFELSERTRAVRPAVGVDLGLDRAGAAQLSVAGRLVVNTEPLRLDSDGDGWLLPESLIGSAVPATLRRIEPPEQMMADIVLRERTSGDEWFVAPPLSLVIERDGDGGRVAIRGAASLHPVTAAAGQPLPTGSYALAVRVDCFGLNRQRPLRAPAGAPVALVLAHRSLLTADESGRLRLVVGAKRSQLWQALNPSAALSSAGLSVRFDAAWAGADRPVVELVAPDGRRTRLRLDRADPDGRLWRKPVSSSCPPGSSAVRIKLSSLGWLDLEIRVQIPRTLRSVPATVRWRARGVIGRARSSAIRS